MKRLTGFVVITLFVVLGCSAAFGEGLATFGLVDNTGTELYCNYLNFSYGTSLASGIDVNQLCGFADGTMLGVVTVFPAGLHPPVSGQVVMLGDSANDAYADTYTGTQPIVVTLTKASKTHYGWEVFYNFYDSFDFVLYNYGYLTKQLPALGPVTKGAAAKSAVVNTSHPFKAVKK